MQFPTHGFDLQTKINTGKKKNLKKKKTCSELHKFAIN